jgi:uncharacterized protein (TIGR00661 family)
MKILYAIQGTGNGHISRARDIIPHLQQKGEVDILISGTQSDVDLNIPVTYRFKGLSFIFGKKGGIDLLATYKKSSLFQLFKEIKSLPIHQYDLVISDFEPVSSWACRLNKKQCIGLSHQAAVSNKKSPKPSKIDPVGKAVLKYYAPVDYSYGFHFEKYDDKITTPVIRSSIRNAKPKLGGHYTVYLPAYSDERIIKVLGAIKNINWHVFSKTAKSTYQKKNIKFSPVDDASFIKSMVNSLGVLCGAGFETPAEALFLGKKLLVIPMKTQYEQQCNAAALKKMGVQSIKSLKKKHLPKIEHWVEKGISIKIQFPDNSAALVNQIIKEHNKQSNKLSTEIFSLETVGDLKKITLEKMLSQNSK